MRALEFDALTLKAAATSERTAKLSLEITKRRLAAGDAQSRHLQGAGKSV